MYFSKEVCHQVTFYNAFRRAKCISLFFHRNLLPIFRNVYYHSVLCKPTVSLFPLLIAPPGNNYEDGLMRGPHVTETVVYLLP